MNKRHFQNCLSIEKKIFESNVKKYERLIEMERQKSEETAEYGQSKKIKLVPYTSEVIIPDPVASTSAGVVNYVKCSKILPGSVDTVIHRIASIDGKVKCQLIKSIAPSSTKNEDILAVLKQVKTRLDKLEQNQKNIQIALSNVQTVILNNQQQIVNSMENIEASIVSKPEMMAQSQLLMELKISIKRVEESVCRMTGESYNNSLDEVASMLPLKTLAAVQEVEQKLRSAEFTQAMVAYLHKLKGASEDVSSVIRAIFTDDLLELYNWEGRWEKQALGKLMLFNKILRDVFQQQRSLDFEKSVRKAVELSHHRMKQKKYLQKEKK